MSQQAGNVSALSSDTTFTIDRDRIMYETLDDETIVIDLGTGTYYSIGGCGVGLWAAVADGTPLGVVVEDTELRYPGVASLPDIVHAWINQLCDEGLVQIVGGAVAGNQQKAAADDRHQAPNPADGADPSVFRPPVLSRYTDMQALLLLDPVHEVDAGAGWPSASVDRT